MKKVLWALLSLGLLFGMAQAQTVRVAGGSVGVELELSQQLAQMYMEQNPDVTVEVIQTPDQTDDRFAQYLQIFEAQSPDIDVMQLDVIWPGQLAQHLVNLYDYDGVQEIADQHFPAIVEANTVDGSLVAIPWFTDAGLLYYRTDLLEKYGFDGPPQTWSELEDMSNTIQEGERQENQDFSAFVWQGNAYEGLTCDALEWVYSSNGGSIISPDEVITINNPAAADIISRAAGWVGTISPQGVTGFAEEDARNFFQAGNAVFMRNWPYAYGIMNGDDSPIAGNFDVSPLPAGENGSAAATLGGWNLGVSRYSNNIDAAVDVAKFFTSEEAQKMRAIEGSFNPTIPALYEDQEVLEAVPFFGSLYDVFINAVARPSAPAGSQYNEVSRQFFTAVHNVLTGQEEADVALELLSLDLQDLTGFETGEPQAAGGSSGGSSQ